MSGLAQLDVYNLALSYLGTSKRVESINETTPQANACNQFWDRARKIVLEQCYWSFATRATPLALLTDQLLISDPSQLIYPGWRFIYAKPTDALKVQAVTSIYGVRTIKSFSYWWRQWPTQWGPYRPAWKESLDYTSQSSPGQSVDILTDEPNAWAIYTVDPPNFAVMSETMGDCIAWHLGVRIAGPVSANPANIKNAEAQAVLSLSRALAQNLNEEQPDDYPDSPAIQARL